MNARSGELVFAAVPSSHRELRLKHIPLSFASTPLPPAFPDVRRPLEIEGKGMEAREWGFCWSHLPC